ncbi:hypothetical protein CANINC_001536 [Pichia inconspicua]|uniref:GYF domain-containing protein n=1 Tax=Pichia inconspicua TaxID=52247 RepID=A0A4T0X4M0_9ASCO|nr:hypothetical protein CANINC_001536 [[Candida] inconspicua]
MTTISPPKASTTHKYPVYAVSDLLDVYTSLVRNNLITIDQEAAKCNSARADTLQVPPIVEFLVSNTEQSELDVQNHGSPTNQTSLNTSQTPDTTNATINSATTQQQQQQQTQQQQDLISPELTSWYYTDLSNNIQGPFSSATMQNWFLQGHLNSDLQVRREIDISTVTIANLYKKCKSLSNFSPEAAPFNQPLPQSLALPSLSAFNSTSSIFGATNNSQFFNEQSESRANSSYLQSLNMLDTNLGISSLPVNSDIPSYSNMMNMGMGMGMGMNLGFNSNMNMGFNMGMNTNMNLNMPNINMMNNQNYNYGANNNMLDPYMQLNNMNSLNSMSSSINSLAPLVNNLSLDDNLLNIDSTTTSANGLGTPLMDTFDAHILSQTHNTQTRSENTNIEQKEAVNEIPTQQGLHSVTQPELESKPAEIISATQQLSTPVSSHADSKPSKLESTGPTPASEEPAKLPLSDSIVTKKTNETPLSSSNEETVTKHNEKLEKSNANLKTLSKSQKPCNTFITPASTIPSVDLTQHIKELEMEKKQKIKEEQKQRELSRQKQLMEEKLAEAAKVRLEQIKLKEQSKNVKQSSLSPTPAPWATVKKPIKSFDEVQREEKEKLAKLASSKPSTPSISRALADTANDIAPWASATPKQATKSFDEIQREEKEKRQRELEERRKIEESDRILASKLALEDLPTVTIKGKKKIIPLSAITSSKPESNALPSSSAWGSVSSTSSNSFKNIIEEQANALAEIKQRASSNKPTSVSEDTSSWTIVSKEKPKTNNTPPVVQPVRNPAIVPSTVKSAVQPQPVYTPPAPKPASLMFPPQAIELLTWARSQLKGLYPGVNKEDMLGMWLSFPINEGQEIIADTIYSNSATMDGRRFANEFIKRRERVESLIHRRHWDFDWFDAIIGTAGLNNTNDVTANGDNDEWEGAFTVVKNKRRK